MKKLPIAFLFFCALVSGFAENRWERQFSVAKNRFLEADYEVALHEFQQYIRLFPGTEYEGDAYYFIGQSHYYLGDYSSALTSFNRVRFKYPASRYARVVGFWEGVTLLGLDRYEEGYDALKNYLDSNETAYKTEAVYYLSTAAMKLGRDSEGFEYMKSLITSGDKPEPYQLVSLMKTGVASGEDEQTLEILSSLHEKFPDDTYITFLLAEMYFYTSDFEKSRELYKYLSKNVSKVSEEINSYLLLRELYFSKDVLSVPDFQAAFDAAEEALAGDKRLLGELWELAMYYYYDKNEAVSALSIFQKMRTSSVAMSYALVARAVDLYERSDDIENGISVLNWYMEQCSEGSDDYFKTSYGLAALYAKNGDWTDAMALLEQENGYKPADEQWRYLYAQGLFNQKDYDGCTAQAASFLEDYPASAYYNDAVLLAARCYRDSGNLGKAQEYYEKLISADGYGFTKAEYISVLFNQRKYTAVTSLRYTAEENNSPVFLYYRGLSFVILDSYDKGIPLLEKLNTGSVDASLQPYVLFYLGWSKYRMSKFNDALANYKELFQKYPNSEMVTSAKYTAGWCAFSTGDFAQATSYFSDYAVRSEYASDRNKGLFMSARSQRRAGQTNKAILTLGEVIASESGGYWKEAYFELGDLFLETGAVDKAIDAYGAVFKRDPEDPDGFRGMLEAGKAAYSAKRYEQAVTLFRTLRDSGLKTDKMVDVYYYWGLAYRDEGKQYSAILIWDKLVENYPKSVYVFEVQVSIASMYQEMGEFKKAADIYAKLITQFPDDSSNIQIDVELDKLKFMIQGQSDREAALSARIGKLKGASTKDGRTAIIELGKLYILNETRKSQLDFVLDLLKQVIDKKGEDPDSASRAMFLYGEYLAREGDYDKATDSMLDAALLSPGPEDFIAQALFRAASTAAAGRNKTDARAIVATLLDRFPDSVWAEEGRKLEGGL